MWLETATFLPGVAAVLSGKTPAALAASAASSAGGGGGGGVSALGKCEESVLVSRGRAVFKPVVNRIDSLELQVKRRDWCNVVVLQYLSYVCSSS